MSGLNDVDVGLSGPTFTTVDYAVFSLMLAASVGIGVYSAIKGRGNTSSEDYLLGGRTMSPVPVAFSLLGGVISAISILGNATEMYFYGTQLVVSLLGFLPGCVLVSQVTLPVLYNLKLVSVNDYIELRYRSRALRKLVTFLQLLTTTLAMGIFLYAPSLALSAVTSLPTSASVVIMGALCTLYISIGGVKAVVYTDVLQTSLMFLGVLVVVVICTLDLGGVGVVWDSALQGSRVEFLNFDTSPFVRHTVWSTMSLGCFIMIFFTGFQQTSYQRFACVNTLRTAKTLCVVFVGGLYLLWLLFFFCGLVAYAIYKDCDPFTSGRISKQDQILPFLVMDKLSYLPGVPGIFVAAVYGAVLSSFSSYGNSMACMVWEDFLKDLSCFKSKSEKTSTNVMKLLSLVAGVLGIGAGLLAGQLGSLFQLINTITGALYGPLAGVFLAGICTPWVNAKGAAMGCIASIMFCTWSVVGSFIYGGSPKVSLPLSTQGCQENGWSFVNNTFITFNSTSLFADTMYTSTPDDGSSVKTIYDISYCYTGVIGVLMTFILSSFFSLCTGPLSPSSLAEGVVNPTCGRLHKWLWQVYRGPETPSSHCYDLKDESNHQQQIVRGKVEDITGAI
nr:sodium-coupled monocarboxylate transporter 1-like [Procambarus clarkii]